MAEVFSTVTGAAATLEQCIKLFSRVRQASERQKDLPDIIQRYTADARGTISLIEVVEREKSLNTPNTGESLTKLGTLSHNLQMHLETMGATGSSVQEFIKQLVYGRDERGRLDTIMRDIQAAKLNLSLCIQLSTVGLTRGIGEALAVDASAVDAVNHQLTNQLGKDHRLKIAEFLEGRHRDGNSMVTLDEDDIATLAKALKTDIKASTPQIRGTRAIRNNKAIRRALQVNCPIGVDLWADVGVVRIEENVAKDGSSQFNYPMTADNFLASLEVMKGRP